LKLLKLHFKILSDDTKMKQIKVLVLKLFGFGFGSPSKGNLLSKETKMGIMAEQTKHDQICIETIKTMSHVVVVVRLSLGISNVFHDFVFSLARDLVAGQHNFASLPVGVFRNLLVDKVPQLLG
jgi:hypothetical protein